MDVVFDPSAYPPLALGFFGLGTGYLVYRPHELFGYPPQSAETDRALGVWGIWLPGMCQFVTGLILFIGLSWFEVFTKSPPLYMAALAFSAYGIHWFAMGWNRYRGNEARTNAGMCVAYMVISAMGATVFFRTVFFRAGDWPVGLLFVGLFVIYFCHFFSVVGVKFGERGLGLFHILTGGWLMYLTYAVAVNSSLGYHWRV